MNELFRTCLNRVAKHCNEKYAGVVHGDFVNDAEELEFDMEFSNIGDAGMWADMVHDSYGFTAEIRAGDTITRTHQGVVLTVRVTALQAAGFINSKESAA